jgi:carboxypeptidase Q
MLYTRFNMPLTTPKTPLLTGLKVLVLALLFALTGSLKAQVYTKEDSLFIRNIFNTALTKAECYDNLEHICKKIGHRLSGSDAAAKAVDYTYSVMQKADFDTVFKQDVMVPHWVRGDEKASVSYDGKKQAVKIKALGGSIATPKKGIVADVIEVQGLEDIAKLGKDKIQGKIVFFNRPMDPTNINTFVSYGTCVDQRWAGPSEAAKYGAVGTIVRSMTMALDDNPHTGSMRYVDSFPKIPCGAISTLAANDISAKIKAGKKVVFKMQLGCETLPDAPSHNVVGQLNGKSNDFIICGGHLDSWDVGDGAHDDGAGCVQSIEALRLLKMVGYKPNHNLRSVMFMNEENGLKGGTKYAELADKNNEKHLFALESDEGGFTPRGFHIEDNKDSVVAWIQKFRPLLEPYGLFNIEKGGGGADVSRLRPSGTVCMNFFPDSQRYFDYHHADTDTFDKVNKRELVLGAASMAALIYLIDKYYPTK